MPLFAGARLGPYEILSPIGAGGMGEVYKARDVRLGRTIAIKILPPEFASDRERLKRFEQEARAASALNHPNILTIHDVGAVDSLQYIAMEYVEGRTLQALLSKGSLPIKKSLDVGVQLAEGLAAAHQVGIAHRDLKPSNVVVSPDGHVKILDFGLAKLSLTLPSELVNSRALTRPDSHTAPGAILGTVGYMSPEQASGKPIDFRSDQFSLGVILYEMATGKRAFVGDTDVDVLAAILHDEPTPMRELQSDLPPPYQWLVERCLAKAPSDRFASTSDLAKDLRGIREHLSEIGGFGVPPRATVVRRIPFWTRLLLSLAAAAVLVVAVGLYLAGRQSLEVRTPMTFTIPAPSGTEFNFDGSSPAPVSLSPDGGKVAFGANDRNGRSALWVRSLSLLTPELLPGTEGATYPFWAPDSKHLAFFMDGKLKTTDLSRPSPETICDARDGRGGTWNQDGILLFAPDSSGPIFRVSSEGGTPVRATAEDGVETDFSHRWPFFLPDGKHFLYLATFVRNARHRPGIFVGSLESSERHFLLPDVSNAVFARPEFVLFLRGASLRAVRVDPTRVSPLGPSFLVVQGVNFHPYRWNGAFSVSGTRLVYQGWAATAAELSWLDRSGRFGGTVGGKADYGGLRLSPDGRQCAVEVRDATTGIIDIWNVDLLRGVSNRVTSGGSSHIAPVWSPEGDRVAFASDRSGHYDLYLRFSNGTGPEDSLFASASDNSPTDWSSTGYIFFNHSTTEPNHKSEIWVLSPSTRRARAFLADGFNERDATLSPDGHFVAYSSDESGREEVYVRSFDGGLAKVRVSLDGGRFPSWRMNGHELFYLAGATLMLADLRLSPRCEVLETKKLFEAAIRTTASNIAPFSVQRDGDRILIVVSPIDTGIAVRSDWTAGLTN